jgi:hypothetical protein
MVDVAPQNPAKQQSQEKKLSLESRSPWAILGLWGLSCQMSLLESLHQSLIFRHQLWASLSSAPLVFKQPLHQLGEVFHDFLHGWPG